MKRWGWILLAFVATILMSQLPASPAPGDRVAYPTRPMHDRLSSSVHGKFSTSMRLATYSSHGRMSKEDKRKVDNQATYFIKESTLPIPASAAWFAPDGTIYAGTTDAVYKSTNGGTQWTLSKQFDANGYKFYTVWVDPATSYVFASLGEGTEGHIPLAETGLWRSTDAGATWSRVLGPDQDVNWVQGVTVFNIDYDTTGNLYLGTYTMNFVAGSPDYLTIWKSTNHGATWSNITPTVSPLRNHMHQLAVDRYTNPNAIYAVLGEPASAPYSNGDPLVMKSTNGGTSWSTTLAFGNISTAQYPTFQAGNFIHIGDGYRVITLEEKGQGHFIRTTDDVNYTDVLIEPQGPIAAIDSQGWWMFPFFMSESPNGNIYAPMKHRSVVFASSDEGVTWENIREDNPEIHINGAEYISNFYGNKAIICKKNSHYAASNYSGLVEYDPATLIEETTATKFIYSKLATSSVAGANEHTHAIGDGALIGVDAMEATGFVGDGTRVLADDNTWKLRVEGNDTEIQYNNGGVLGAASRATYDDTAGSEAFTVTNTGSVNTRGLVVKQFSTNIAGATFTGVKGRGTESAPIKVESGDYIYGFNGRAYDDTIPPVLRTPLLLAGQVSGTATAGGVPSSWVFETGSAIADRSARLKIWHNGLVELTPTSTGLKFPDGSTQVKAAAFSSGSGAYVQLGGSPTGSFTHDTAIYRQSLGVLRADDFVTASSSLNTAYDTAALVNTRIPAPGAAGYVPFGVAGSPTTYTTDSAVFWDNSNKRLAIGHTSPAVALDVRGSSATASQIVALSSAASGANSGGTLTLAQNDGTVMDSTESLGRVLFQGAKDATTQGTGARIQALAEGTFSGSSYPTALTISTVSSGSTTLSERVRVAANGLTTNSNGGGVPFAHCYLNNADPGVTITVSAANTWYEVDDGSTPTFTSGLTKNATHTDHYLTAVTAGYYQIDYSVSLDTATASDEIAATVMVNNVASVTAHSHGTVAAGNSASEVSGLTILNLAANDQVSIAVENHTGARNIIVHHAQLRIIYLGAP